MLRLTSSLTFFLLLSLSIKAQMIPRPLSVSKAPVFGSRNFELRPLRAEDQQRLERLWQVATSPDGQWLVYSLERSRSSGVSQDREALRSLNLRELWIAPVGGGEAKKIAGGGSDGVGFWLWVWSPDSRRVAMKSVAPDGTAGLWVWEQSSGRLRRLVAQGLGNQLGLPQWLSDHQLLYDLIPEGGTPPHAEARGTVDAANKDWSKGLGGREASVSVLDSGIPQPQRQGRLALIDSQTGDQRTVLTGNCEVTHVAPGGRYISCLRETDMTQIATGGSFREGPTFILDLAVATSDGTRLNGTDALKDLVPYSMRWSPDGSQLAVIGKRRLAAEAPLEIFIYRPGSQTLTSANTPEVNPVVDYYGHRPQLIWTGNDGLLIYAQPAFATTARADWWAVSEKGQPRNVTQQMKAAPTSLLPEGGGTSFLGVAQGKLWRIRPDETVAEDLSTGLEIPLTSIFWPSRSVVDPIDYSIRQPAIIVSAQRTTLANEQGESRVARPGEKGVQSDLFSFDLGSGKYARLQMPSPSATFMSYSAPQGTAAFSVNDRTGTYLWLYGPGSNSRLVLQTNTFLKDVAEPQWKKVEYRGLDGQNLIGWVLLPVDYQEGKRYPLIADVYMGNVYGGTPPSFQSINDTIGATDGPLLTAHGYAVLFPSMPRAVRGVTNDNYMDLANGVLPAVDKVIDLGIADPKRLGAMGGSYGGFSVYGLITQTKRFQAAVAMAGISDWISLWGQFNGYARYDAFPEEGTIPQEKLIEGGQAALGAPPWKDVERYVRNSPIFYADRVETPILMIQGDFDQVPIQQGEEFFMAMYRQDKRARFLRYWSSGHVIGGANRVDMWKQIYAWFDEFLMKPEKAESSE